MMTKVRVTYTSELPATFFPGISLGDQVLDVFEDGVHVVYIENPNKDDKDKYLRIENLFEDGTD